MKIVIGTRGSVLARTQTELVAAALRSSRPELEIEIRPIRTEGDVRVDRPLAEIGGKGLFVKELERALQRGVIDLAVHSLKDVPAFVEDGLVIGAVPPRGDVRDVLISRDGSTFHQLRNGAVVATGSMRRSVQLRAMRPDVVVLPIRGNVDTRLRKLDSGEFDALVLAAAGLERLGRSDRVTEYFDVEELIPSVGQGALAVEHRADSQYATMVAELDDPETRVTITAERAFLGRLGAGCQLPVAAYARLEGDRIAISGMIGRQDGSIARSSATGVSSMAEELGRRLAEELLGRVEEAATR